ncbi:MAG: hypothetical protein COA47_14525 [Robiginitomaculum sp.]|nr:MAG: hypothetical protein COA47_14525 [Robiginitomaculum sp.]
MLKILHLTFIILIISTTCTKANTQDKLKYIEEELRIVNEKSSPIEKLWMQYIILEQSKEPQCKVPDQFTTELFLKRKKCLRKFTEIGRELEEKRMEINRVKLPLLTEKLNLLKTNSPEYQDTSLELQGSTLEYSYFEIVMKRINLSRKREDCLLEMGDFISGDELCGSRSEYYKNILVYTRRELELQKNMRSLAIDRLHLAAKKYLLPPE